MSYYNCSRCGTDLGYNGFPDSLCNKCEKEEEEERLEERVTELERRIEKLEGVVE